MSTRKQIAIEGQQRPYPEGVWVVFTPDGFPSGVMNTSAKTGDDPVKAAREFWDGPNKAIRQLAAGYRIELTTRQRWRNELMPIHLGTAAQGGAA
jgi:hypothetical protein